MTDNSFINDALSKQNHLCQSLFEDNNAKDVILDDGCFDHISSKRWDLDYASKEQKKWDKVIIAIPKKISQRKIILVCTRDMNQCLDNPCQNGGTFTQKNGCFTCTCTDGYAGAHCNEVVSNLALNKPAKQSSTYTWGGVTYSSNLAVDGNNGTDFVEDKCSCTATGENSPWWRVDLQAVYLIKSVRIFNRGMDQYGIDTSDRLWNVTVTVGLTESDVNTPCGFFAGPGTLSQLVVDVDCMFVPKGRFVKIAKTTEFLTLCEVEVFGYSA